MPQNSSDRLSHQLSLEIKTPSLFRCPISLEVMRSPVSLSTGVTYDRSSIQRWLDSGNATCPATMLPLSTTDLIPNLTLRRLINIWASSPSPNKNRLTNYDYAPADVIQQIRSSPNPLPSISKLAAFFQDPDVDDTVKNGLINVDDFAAVAVSALTSASESDVAEAVVDLVSFILSSDCIETGSKERVISAFRTEFDASFSSLVSVLRGDESSSQSKANSVRILGMVIPGSLNQEKMESLIRGLVDLLSNEYRVAIAVDEALGCMMQLLSLPSKQLLKTMVECGVVEALVRVLSQEVLAGTAEKGILILEAVSSFGMGRAAVFEVLGECVEAVMGRMMKGGREGREAAVGVLWSVCYGTGGEKSRRAKEAVAGVKGGMAKILVVMQGECSPPVRRMAGDLLKVFRVDANSFIAGYDTKTTHIMPF